ncbi:hypothetical protein GLOIN_2v1783868 [Rhizophagus irregularis DAOM 181602=DAOM 197198]|uniref:Uncharacterized protein n=1 Tax=Rhizophagus irregularis (strain DAOM 181602 / DAOM 197198 / MUCL 43194) TaxID=747089 RepID=A0A2P4PE49_RHIID|nr:hypothetical protein GLOIN_2v1783868 [Rhizophagus irregularis DAOM 181602=DAOM 197198]POG63650.1 hypothetical protein GLOIN_2v1783868 [Rhizophagus irregularis DAOM 181602=DAOM 197198]GBC41817.2 hypothetical protein GLOIN_2v1783868 [Rhizophagus irregularis DAOM 181602=DAOM 197198]|eukprot:XP_025170516.1 hypothetical protein GLOIN_2v1783868 [Rhizophagus irregularis DAOM 181602=DAOM 197198]
MTEQIDDRLSSSMVCSSGPLEYRSETLDLEMVNLHQAFASAPSVRVTGVQARRNSETLNPTNISIQLLDEEDGTFVLKITKGGKLGKVNMVEVKSRVDHKKIKEKIGGKRESKDIVSWIIRELEKENNEIRINIILTSKDTFNIILHGLIIALLLIDKNNHLYIKTSEKIEAMISKLGRIGILNFKEYEMKNLAGELFENQEMKVRMTSSTLKLIDVNDFEQAFLGD